jgi:hypothetical protein
MFPFGSTSHKTAASSAPSSRGFDPSLRFVRSFHEENVEPRISPMHASFEPGNFASYASLAVQNLISKCPIFSAVFCLFARVRLFIPVVQALVAGPRSLAQIFSSVFIN